jgi:hypothetical protein
VLPKKIFLQALFICCCLSSFVFAQNTQVLYYSHGKYVGEAFNNKAHGFGTYTSYKSGTVYTGNFYQDTFSGQGTMFWTNGSKFVGNWQNDSAIQGTMFYPNGSSAPGVVRNAVFIPNTAPYTPPPTPSNPNQLNKSLYSQLGPTGWADCVSGQVAIAALIARGDSISQSVKDTNRSLGNVLGSLRQYMLSNGTPASILDDLVRNSSAQIKNGDQAVKIMTDCTNQIARINY